MTDRQRRNRKNAPPPSKDSDSRRKAHGGAYGHSDAGSQNDRRPGEASQRSRSSGTPPQSDRGSGATTQYDRCPGAISQGACRFAREIVALEPLRDISQMPLPELLLPAGSPLALEAAIEAGADAVYFGARSYSARARAENFDDTEVVRALRLCHVYGVRAYAALNTRLRGAEMEDALRIADLLVTEGVDAFITADLGLSAMLRRRFGDAIQLHASTQLTSVSSYDARALCELGFSRVVAPRELTLGQLGELCGKSPIEIEAFVHGAHCVSLSGQCLMSSVIGGRSANRGECAQPCRMEYACGKKHGALLSLADMCYAPDIPAVISTGVRSLKVEGRQKDAAYVYGVGRLYRRLLDERRGADSDEIAALAELFERGFTDGYLRGSFDGMLGVRRADAPHAPTFGGLKRKIAVDAKLILRVGHAPSLSLTDGASLSATAALDTASQIAEGEGLSAERAERQIGRMGQTPFELRGFELDTDGRVWLGAAELNELRRRAAEALTRGPHHGASRASKMPLDAGGCGDSSSRADGKASALFPRLGEIPAPSRVAGNAPRRTASFTDAAQIPPEAFDYFDVIYLPYTELTPEARRLGVQLSLPPYMTDEAAKRLAAMIRPGDRVLVHSVGQIYFVRELGAVADASFRLNVWNAQCQSVIAALCDGGSVTLSPELGGAALRALSREANSAAVVYGKLPVMYTVRCMIRGEACRGGRGGMTGALRDSGPCRAYLRDRTGAEFFALGMRDCANEIYNSVPTWTADRPLEGCREHFVFSDESAERVAEVIEAYRLGQPPQMKVRRIAK